MARIEFGLPSLGHTMSGAVILRWGKETGDQVTQGEFVLEVETDKVDVAIESFVNGRLMERLADAGQTCPVGQVIAIFETE
jgi:pyruvate/2-oxoglutarate dehydrogenase complex dihydrolipoamide acyltransferase (E2) component